MSFLLDFSRRQLIAAGIIVLAALIGTGILAARSSSHGPRGDVRIIEPGSAGNPVSSPSKTPSEPAKLCVYVSGKVKSPGVYQLSPGSRVTDALKAAGGALPNADVDMINLAEKLTDGEQVFIAAKGVAHVPAVSGVRGGSPPAIAKNPSAPVSGKEREKQGPEKLTNPGQGTVNINSAGLTDLQKLPGIGPAMAQRILDYRTKNGRFQAVDELDEVKGIGAAKLAKLRPFVTL